MSWVVVGGKNLTREEQLANLVHILRKMASHNDVEGIIEKLRSETRSDGLIHPDNERELNIWNMPAGEYFLRRGKYSEAELIYGAFYEQLLEQQKTLGRLHKGMALHNLAVSLFFQGKTEPAIRFFICAYIEDVITAMGAARVEQAPASSVLRGFCGVPQKDMMIIRDNTLVQKDIKVFTNPETILDSPGLEDVYSRIQRNYHEYIPNTWEWERNGQLALEKGDYERSFEIYKDWFSRLLEYQEIIKDRVHKGHPLFNSGIACFLWGKREPALEWVLLAYIEDVISALNPKDADGTAAFKNLSSWMGSTDILREIENIIFETKRAGGDLSDPRLIARYLAASQEKAIMEVQKLKEKIQSARDERDRDLLERISRKCEITDQNDNTFYVLKRWNSATPRYPPEEPTESLGGGYFLLWNKKGIVIDPGYDFLRIFYKKGFGLLNIDLIIVTHAHDDHCQDLEAIFSVLYKLNKNGIKHKIDLVISEAVQIKYGRLLTILKECLNNVLLKQGDLLDPASISGEQYCMKIEATKTDHNEEPWMKHNTGVGLVLSLERGDETQFRIGITGDTAFWEGIERVFSGVDLLIEHIGTYGTSSSHLCEKGCVELLKKMEPPPALVVVSEFGEELKGHRENICTLIETTATGQIASGDRMPVIAGDIGLKIRIPSLEIFCTDTKQYEQFTMVMDKEIHESVEYVKKE